MNKSMRHFAEADENGWADAGAGGGGCGGVWRQFDGRHEGGSGHSAQGNTPTAAVTTARASTQTQRRLGSVRR